MRKEKFDSTKNFREADDIMQAFMSNGLKHELENIDVIVAEVCGQNDGDDWYWILQMKDGTFAHAQGGCDYTGWVCRSNAQITKDFKTAQEALDHLKMGEYETRKGIKENLLCQLNDEQPFATFKPQPTK